MVVRYRAGVTVRQLATEFGIHRATVGRHLEARGVDTRQLKLSRKVVEEAARLYLGGAILDELAAQYSVSYTTMHRCLVAMGIKLRSRGRQAAPNNFCDHGCVEQ